MYYSENGDELKKFNTRDGMGIALIRMAGIKVGIITSEDRELNLRRAEKLKVDFLRQGKSNGGKLEVAKEIVTKMGITLQEVAYIGDDLNDMKLLNLVGWAGVPSSAPVYVQKLANVRLEKKGGEGVFREFVENILGTSLVDKIVGEVTLLNQ